VEAPGQNGCKLCNDTCSENRTLQLALAYHVGFCGLQDGEKSKQLLGKTSRDEKWFHEITHQLKTYQIGLRYTGIFQSLHLSGVFHLEDFTDQNSYSVGDQSFDDAKSREVIAFAQVVGVSNIVTILLKQALSSSYRSRYDLSSAIQLEEEILDSMLQGYGESYSYIPKTMLRLCSMYCQLERYQKALDICERAVNLTQIFLGGEHPSTLSANASLASTLWACGKWNEAEHMFSQLVRQNVILMGEHHPESLVLKANLAMAKKKLRNLDDAEKIEQEAAALSFQTLGPHSAVTWMIYSNLSQTYDMQKRFKESETLLNSLRQDHEGSMADVHPQKLGVFQGLARAYTGQHRFREAQDLLGSIGKIQESLLGPLHPETLKTSLLLAKCFHQEGSEKEAATRTKELLQMYSQKSLAATDVNFRLPSDWEEELACFAHGQHLWSEVESLEEQIVARREEAVGLGHYSTITATAYLCETLAEQGKYDRADQVGSRLSQDLLKQLDKQNSTALRLLARLGSMYMEKNELDRAERVLKKAWRAALHVLGLHDTVTLFALCNLSSAYALKGMHKEALVGYLKAIRAKIESLGEDDPSTQTTIANFKYFCSCTGMDADGSLEKLRLLTRR